MRPGYKESLVMKAGIKITPVGLGKPGTECKDFMIRVTKRNKRGKEIEVKGAQEFRTYPLKSTGDTPGIYVKIAEIYNYYYNKIMRNRINKATK